MAGNGVFIVLEGSDGSGKSTQFNLLKERLKATGYDVEVFKFPQYEQKSSHFIKKYLNGEYGKATSISPYTASLFYALDRFEAAGSIRSALDKGKIVLADRFVGANMAFQGAKFNDQAEQRGFFVWEDNLEFQLLQIPRPDINIFLRVPAEVSQELLKKHWRESGTKADEHEKDLNFLKKTVDTYDLLCQLFPKDFKEINCTLNNKLLGIAEINNMIWQTITPLLPSEKPNPSHSVVVTLGEQEPISPKPVSESRNKLNHTFRDVSLLLKLQIEHLSKASISNESNRWSNNAYAFYTPRGLPKEVESHYKNTLSYIAEIHKEITVKLESFLEKNMLNSSVQNVHVDELLKYITPRAALTSFSTSINERAVNKISSNLLANDLHEVQWAAKQLYLAARQQWPDKFDEPLESTTAPESINNIIAKLAEEKFSFNDPDREEVKLLEALPRQEFDLLAEGIYPFSNLSLEDIVEEVTGWPYQQKYESLKQAVVQSAHLLDKIRYKVDIVSDQLFLSQIIGAADVSNLQVQASTPNYGYEVPEILEKAGVEDLFLECFDESLKLYSALQSAEREDLAQYATLAGHKIRWQFSTDATQMKKILEFSASSTYKKISVALREKVYEAHPLIWDILSLQSNLPAKNLSQVSRNRVKPQSRRRKSRRSTPNGPSETNL